MADVALTERFGAVKLQCQICPYEGAISFAPAGVTLLRQAKLEAYDHCWAEHRIPAYKVKFTGERDTGPLAARIEEQAYVGFSKHRRSA